MKSRIAILFLIALPLYAADEMRKLDWWIGEWKGEASITMGPGKTEHALQTERVQARAGGRVLMIEGLGKRKLEDGTAGDVVHDAFAVVSWNEKTKSYDFDAWTARDGHVKAWLEAGDDHSAKWGFDTPQGGKIRYTIRLTDAGEWHEVGEFFRGGDQWIKFFDMTLAKAK